MFFTKSFEKLDSKWQALNDECKQRHETLVNTENLLMLNGDVVGCDCGLFDNYDAKHDKFWEKHIICFKQRSNFKLN